MPDYSEHLESELETADRAVPSPESPSVRQLVERIGAGGSITSSPNAAHGIVYFGANDGCVYALDAVTGELRWRFRTGGPVIARPAISGRHVLIPSFDGYLYALDAASGEQRWRFYAGDMLSTNPAVAHGRIYVGSLAGLLFALTPDGEELWRCQVGHAGCSLVAHDKIYVGTEPRICAVSKTGQILWHYPTGSYCGSAAAIDKRGNHIPEGQDIVPDLVIIGSWDSYVYALTADGILRWKAKTGDVVSPRCPPPVANGTVYFGSNDGNLYACDVRDGAVRWRYNVGERTYVPTLAGDTLYLSSTASKMIAVSTDGKPVWEFSTGGAVSSVPLVANGAVYFGCWDAYLYALDAKTGELLWRYRVAEAPSGREFVGTWSGLSERIKKLVLFWKPEAPPKVSGYEAKPMEHAEEGPGYRAWKTGYEMKREYEAKHHPYERR